MMNPFRDILAALTRICAHLHAIQKALEWQNAVTSQLNGRGGRQEVWLRRNDPSYPAALPEPAEFQRLGIPAPLALPGEGSNGHDG